VLILGHLCSLPANDAPVPDFAESVTVARVLQIVAEVADIGSFPPCLEDLPILDIFGNFRNFNGSYRPDLAQMGKWILQADVYGARRHVADGF
jgi:hypothetical protein